MRSPGARCARAPPTKRLPPFEMFVAANRVVSLGLLRYT
jgi:hypothetical protein